MPDQPLPPPTVGRVVHYVSFGTPGGEYGKRCRAATITEVGAWITTATYPPPWTTTEALHSAEGRDEYLATHRIVEQEWDPEACALSVQNPTGLFFNVCRHAEPDGFTCTSDGYLREVSPNAPGGTWHWPERLEPPAGQR